MSEETRIEELIDISGLTPDDVVALQEYRESVDWLSANEHNLEFNNKDEHHAAFVMAAIFKTARNSIKLYTGSLSGEISNNNIYKKYLEESIDSGNKKVEVIFEKKPNENSKCYLLLKELKAKGKDVSMYMLPESYKKTLQKMNLQLGHFAIGDDKMYRYETDTIKFTATCNFDDKKVVSVLNKNFDIFKLNAQVL